MSLALAALLAAAALAAPSPDPLTAPIAEQAARGWSARERVVRPGKPFPLAVVVYGRDENPGNRLEVYGVLKEKAYVLFAHPGATERLQLADVPAGLLGEGARVIAYRSTIPALQASALHILAVRGLKVEKAGEFAEGRFETMAGRTVIAARDLPLGRFLSVGCEAFATTSQNAFRTALHAHKDGRFVDISASHPDFYTQEIARKEAALARLKDDLQKNAGEYLGLALSLYFDHAARGQAREGWERQKIYFALPALAPASVKKCFAAMQDDLRSRLKLPADWR